MNVYFTQIDPPDQDTAEALAKKGWRCRHLPFRCVEWLRTRTPDMSAYDVVVMSSKRAARWYLEQQGLHAKPLAVVGGATSAILAGHELVFGDDPPANAKELAQRLAKQLPKEARLLFVRGEIASKSIPDGLSGFALDQLTVYRTPLHKIDPVYQGGMVYFQAPGSVRDFHAAFTNKPTLAGAIGSATQEALVLLGWPVHFRPSRPETAVMIDEIPSPEQLLEQIGDGTL